VVRSDQPQQDVTADLDSLKADLSKLRGDIADMAGSWVQVGRQRAQGAAADLQDRFHDTMETVEDWVKQKPLQAVLIAAGVGLLLGKLSSRR
jgi:ElaB/YqjD/DUF883 family membrane-anchored ribosome-binding protein